MATPRFTDLHRYPRGYTHAKATNVGKTFAREKKRLAEEAARTHAEAEAIRKAEETDQQEVVRKVRALKKGATSC